MPPNTLDRYLLRRFSGALAVVSLTLASLFALIDLIELLRRSAGKGIDAGTIAFMAVAKLPGLVGELFPFIVLFAGLATLHNLAHANELIIARAVGCSIWRLLTPLLIAAALIGVVKSVVYDPLATMLYTRFETVEQGALERHTTQSSVSNTGLWLQHRHGDRRMIIHARSATTEVLHDVSLYLFDRKDHFHSRIIAATAIPTATLWRMQDGALVSEMGRIERFATRLFPIGLTMQQMRDSAQGERAPFFWQIPALARNMERAGLNAKPALVAFHRALATPVFLAGMVLLAAIFAIQPRRGQGAGWMLLMGVLCSFFLYLFASIAAALGATGRLSAPLAAWLPAAIAALGSVSVLLHLEDG